MFYQLKLFFYKILIGNKFLEYDKRGVRAFVRYSKGSGCWLTECYRKKTKKESQGELDWKMIREANITSYYTRLQAEMAVLKYAKEICKEYKY